MALSTFTGDMKERILTSLAFPMTFLQWLEKLASTLHFFQLQKEAKPATVPFDSVYPINLSLTSSFPPDISENSCAE